MIKGLLTAGIVVVLFSIPVVQAAKLQLLTENFPPVNMSKSGKNFAKGDSVVGISTEIVKLMCSKAGVDCVITLKFPWDRIYKSALELNGYGLFSVTRTPERESSFKWVGPLTEIKWVIFKLASSPISVSSLDDLKSLRVGGYKGDAITNFLVSKGVSVNEALQDQQNVSRLAKDQIDVWATASLSGIYMAKQEGVTGLKEAFVMKTDPLWLALNKETDDGTVSKLSNALAEIKSSPQYTAIHEKYR